MRGALNLLILVEFDRSAVAARARDGLVVLRTVKGRGLCERLRHKLCVRPGGGVMVAAPARAAWGDPPTRSDVGRANSRGARYFAPSLQGTGTGRSPACWTPSAKGYARARRARPRVARSELFGERRRNHQVTAFQLVSVLPECPFRRGAASSERGGRELVRRVDRLWDGGCPREQRR